MSIERTALLLLLVLAAGSRLVLSQPAQPTQPTQATPPAQDPAAPSSGTSQASTLSGERPSGEELLRGFLTDSAGPYSIFMGVAIAGVHQASNNPPEWHQGFGALSSRFGSNMGITAVGNSVRYGLGWATNSEFHFQKCSCKGVMPRVGHAFKSTAVAHRRRDGSEVLSLPNLVAPYAATSTAVYAWYPGRYGMKDAFRMGNYNLLGTVATNLVFEFMPDKALNFLRRFHLSGSH
jgi:hypothetical protein